MQRTVDREITGHRTTDGAGVSLVRVLGPKTIEDFDPILMLDSFDSTDPQDYLAGFPFHPHRGIETITYLTRGRFRHKDSLGNEGVLADGEVQWMTAGSGIMHEEMPLESPRLLGVQLWLNLPQKDKMTPPAYHTLTADDIPEVAIEGGSVRVIGGRFRGTQGFMGEHQPLEYYAVRLQKGHSLEIATPSDGVCLLFTLLGDAEIGDKKVLAKTAVSTTAGEAITLRALEDENEILVLLSQPLKEPVAWGGPIVMNTKEELELAFRELRSGEFIKELPAGA